MDKYQDNTLAHLQHFAWVHDAVGVENMLDFLHQFNAISAL